MISQSASKSIVAYRVAAPAWASTWGEDEYGVYADFEYDKIIQRMRFIAPGRFMMGSPETEKERWEGELQHEVELTEGYWLADTACTQALWKAVMGSNPSRFQKDEDGKSDERPVEKVSWNDCQEFIEKLNNQVPALDLRLPTEAEWEYACRAGTTTPFSFGENITTDQVNFDGNYPYNNGQKGEYRKKTVPVKALRQNPWGLYQMHGNVLEWCADWIGPYESGFSENPKGPDQGEYRVLRGGSWDDNGRLVRSAPRSGLGPGYRIEFYGFRLARGQ